MTEQIVLDVAGATAVAELLTEAAPTSAARLLETLPIRAELRHVRWSGNAAYTLVDALRDPNLQLENRVSFYYPKTLVLRPEHGEVAIAYGQAQARDSMNPAGWATLLAQIEDNAEFFRRVAATQHGGVTPIEIRSRGR